MIKFLFIKLEKHTFFSNLTDLVSKKIDESVWIGGGKENRKKDEQDKENISCDNVPGTRTRKQRRKAN